MRRIELKKGLYLCLLCLILVIACWSRFVGIGERGIVLWDGGHYVEKSISMMYEVEKLFLLKSSPPLLNSCEGKPGHLFVQAMAIRLTGMNITENVILGFQALCGLATVLIVFLVGKKISCRSTGIYAAALFGVSGLALSMARSSNPQADSILIVSLIYLSYFYSLEARMRKRTIILLTGILIGIGSTFHLTVLAVLPAIFLAEIGCVVINKDNVLSDYFRRVGVLSAAVVGTVLGIEAILSLMGSGYIGCIDILGNFVNRMTNQELAESEGVFASLINLISLNRPLVSLRFFWDSLSEIESIFFGVATLLGIGYAVYRSVAIREITNLMPLFHLIIGLVYALWVYSSLKALHHLYIPICLLGGFVYMEITQLTKKIWGNRGHNAVLACVVLVILVSGLHSSWSIITYRSGYDAAFRKVLQLVEDTNARWSIREEWIGHSLSTIVGYYLRKYDSTLSKEARNNIGYFEDSDLVVMDYRNVVNGVDTKLLDMMSQMDPVFRVTNMEDPLPIVHYHRSHGLLIFKGALLSEGVNDLLVRNVLVYDRRQSKN